MACPLLEKIAPETRNLIYEYVLTFDAPLKHAQKMKPFINELYRSSDSETEELSDEGPNHAVGPLQRVDTALLSASRLIFKEAIAVFYENNTIYLDAEHCEAASIVSPLATDLSLATRVTMKFSMWEKDDRSLSGYHNGMEFVRVGFPTVFPKLRTATIVISADNSSEPVKVLFALANTLHNSSLYEGAVFEYAGSVTAYSVGKPRLKVMVQCKTIMERWAAWESEGHELSWSSPFDGCARSVYPPSKDGRVNAHAIHMFNEMRGVFLPDDYPEVVEDSFEFWTIVDDVWRTTQISMQRMPVVQDLVERLRNLRLRQIARSLTQPNDANPEASSGDESGGGDDAPNSSEQLPESESDSGEINADDQASQGEELGAS